MFFFFNDTATTEIYTLSLHDALPICSGNSQSSARWFLARLQRRSRFENPVTEPKQPVRRSLDRKSTRLNSSHSQISYAVFCLKKKRPPPRLARNMIFTERADVYSVLP